VGISDVRLWLLAQLVFCSSARGPHDLAVRVSAGMQEVLGSIPDGPWIVPF